MGIRISSKTWRSPLQFIDSWLPNPVQDEPSHRQPMRLLRRFAEAGWLACPKIDVERTPGGIQGSTQHRATKPAQSRPVRILRPVQGTRDHTRLVISGRMSDVCAELDRLATMEQHAGMA